MSAEIGVAAGGALAGKLRIAGHVGEIGQRAGGLGDSGQRRYRVPAGQTLYQHLQQLGLIQLKGKL